MRYARVANGIVVEVMDVPDDGPPIAELHHPDIVATCVPIAPDGWGWAVKAGWRWDGEVFDPPDAALTISAGHVQARHP